MVQSPLDFKLGVLVNNGRPTTSEAHDIYEVFLRVFVRRPVEPCSKVFAAKRTVSAPVHRDPLPTIFARPVCTLVRGVRQQRRIGLFIFKALIADRTLTQLVFEPKCFGMLQGC